MMEKKGNEIHITSKAKQLLELVPEDLKKPELTADWEMKLSQIAKGRIRQGDFLHQIRDYTCEIVDEIKTGRARSATTILQISMSAVRQKTSGCQWQKQQNAGMPGP